MKKIKTKSTIKEKRQRAQAFFLGCTFRIGLLAFILVLGLMHVLQMSKNSTQGYALSALQNNLQQVSEEVQTIESDIALNQSMVSVKKRLAGSDFVPAQQISFLKEAPAFAVLD